MHGGRAFDGTEGQAAGVESIILAKSTKREDINTMLKHRHTWPQDN